MSLVSLRPIITIFFLGRVPEWYKEAIGTITDPNTGEVHPSFRKNNLFHQYIDLEQAKRKKKHWIMTTHNQEIVIGKKKKVPSDQHIIYTHYKESLTSRPWKLVKN